jgi:hypothetical protein
VKLVSRVLASFSFSALALLAAAACTGDDPEGSLTRPDEVGTADAEVEEPVRCPAAEPRVGSACLEDDGTNQRCAYKMGECVRGGQTYASFYEYCCFRGLWVSCPGPESPCDKPEAEQPDAAVDAPAAPAVRDGGVDGGADGGA